ncbi:sensor histidine kinase [Arthrospiribacter ruber]|uniref:histidine kinase n=1 Tax=Arthrospiribacter ruber TaxID=2487934 RepID=A0A951IYR0_9BACT|nr:ATP-binding protein [Arthrospiribacter ruber]MBW3468649.1 GHKL domain-containing protein [Arthrospiribacter ruber]
MNIWKRYTGLIKRNLGVQSEGWDTTLQWRSVLTYYSLVFIIPLSLIAYIPGVFFAIQENYPSVVLIDSIALSLVLLSGFSPRISLAARNFMFIAALYTVGVGLLFIIGLSGPGFLYMLAASVFCTIIFPVKYAYYPAFINLLISVIFAFLITLEIMIWKDEPIHNIPQFITVASNLVFLGFFISALFPKVFDLLEKSINNERKLKTTLDQKNADLEKALKVVENKHAELETFAYSASHDLQEPLRMITGFLRQLEKHNYEQLDEKGKQYIYFASDGAARMKEMITGLLEYSRVGRFDGKKSIIDVGMLVKESVKIFNESIHEKNAEVIIHPLPVVESYAVPLSQIFHNLIGNALKYRHPERTPRIEVSCAESEDSWIFSVKDNGIGIRPEDQSRIFNLFQKLHHKKDFEGQGIGLAIVKKCVENLGGKIILESDVRNGTNFSFSLTKNL